MPCSDTPYVRTRARFAPCATDTELRRAWDASKEDMKIMEEGSKNALIAMKDMYKRMIADGTIERYLAARAASRIEYEQKSLITQNRDF